MFFINVESDFEKRYDMAKFVPYINDNRDILQSYFVTALKKLPIEGKFFIREESQRLEYVSFKIYGDTQYWWILALYNDIIDFKEEVNLGTIIKYPSLVDLESLYFSITSEKTKKGEIVYDGDSEPSYPESTFTAFTGG